MIGIKNGTNEVVPEKHRRQLRLAGKNAALNWKKVALTAVNRKKAVLTAVNRKIVVLTALNWKSSGVTGVELEKYLR